MNATEPHLFERLGRPDRMRRIAAYDLFHPALPARLDQIAARAANDLHAEISLVSIILDTSQFILGSHGVSGWVADAHGIPAEWSLCSQVVLAGKPLLIADGTTDPRVAGNPLLEMSAMRSYAGVPLTERSGETLGTLCVIDHPARDFDDDEIATLQSAADEALTVLADYRTN